MTVGERRRGGLKSRMARHIAFAVVVSLVLSTLGIVVYRFFSMRSAIEKSARSFSALVSVPLTRSTIMYGVESLTVPLENQVARLIELNEDAERLELIGLDGSVALSAARDRIRVWPAWNRSEVIDDARLVAELQANRASAQRLRVGGRRVYRVVVPPEDVGGYSLSLVATFGYDRLHNQIQRTVLVSLFALALGLIITQRVALVLSSGISGNIDRLQAGVRRIRAGKLDERVEVRSGDEIEELAEAFNAMAADLQRTIERLRSANRELHTLDQMKADLVANVSHELRTPLTALKGYLELLGEGELGELSGEAHRAVTVCGRNIDRLTLRIEELVQMSQMEKAWPSAVVAKLVDLRTLIPTVAEIFEPRMREKDLRYLFESSPELPAVFGDPEWLERAVLNLLDNAVKFTPAGGSIRVVVEECDHEGREGALIRFSDTGVGIPEDELVRVFDRFHQVDPSARRRYGGLGLGLSLVQNIVEAHRGLVWAQSTDQQGSTFLVWLPCRLADEDGATSTAADV